MNDFGVARHGAIANIAVKRFLNEATHGSAQLVAESLRIEWAGDSMSDTLRIVASRRYGTLSPLRYPRQHSPASSPTSSTLLKSITPATLSRTPAARAPGSPCSARVLLKNW